MPRASKMIRRNHGRAISKQTALSDIYDGHANAGDAQGAVASAGDVLIGANRKCTAGAGEVLSCDTEVSDIGGSRQIHIGDCGTSVVDEAVTATAYHEARHASGRSWRQRLVK